MKKLILVAIVALFSSCDFDEPNYPDSKIIYTVERIDKNKGNNALYLIQPLNKKGLNVPDRGWIIDTINAFKVGDTISFFKN